MSHVPIRNVPAPTSRQRTEQAYAPGKHVLLDFIGARHLSDAAYIENALRMTAEICGATVLHIHLHAFGEEHGVTGVAVLAESHISVHTWPEMHFMALDIFMCGRCDAGRAIEPLKAMFEPERTHIREMTRGFI